MRPVRLVGVAGTAGWGRSRRPPASVRTRTGRGRSCGGGRGRGRAACRTRACPRRARRGRAAAGRGCAAPLALHAADRFELAVVEEDAAAMVALLDLHTGAGVGAHDAPALRALHVCGHVRSLLTGRTRAVHRRDPPAAGHVRLGEVQVALTTASAAVCAVSARANGSSTGHGSPSAGTAGPPAARYPARNAVPRPGRGRRRRTRRPGGPGPRPGRRCPGRRRRSGATRRRAAPAGRGGSRRGRASAAGRSGRRRRRCAATHGTVASAAVTARARRPAACGPASSRERARHTRVGAPQPGAPSVGLGLICAVSAARRRRPCVGALVQRREQRARRRPVHVRQVGLAQRGAGRPQRDRPAAERRGRRSAPSMTSGSRSASASRRRTSTVPGVRRVRSSPRRRRRARPVRRCGARAPRRARTRRGRPAAGPTRRAGRPARGSAGSG